MAKFQVIVGNLGTVYDGNDADMAEQAFAAYKETSAAGLGRAGGEPVTLFKDGEVKEEYEP